MQTGSIIEAAGRFITAKYEEHPKSALVYHNLVHTRQVVAAADQIAAHYRLEDRDQAVVLVAAWFHDVGYLLVNGKGHEEKGAELARSFLQEQQAPEDMQEQVANCILATRMPQSPHNLLEEIVCDADLFHLGSRDYKERSKLMRQELCTSMGKDISSHTWTEGNLLFLENHQYFTEYCRVLLKQQKEENIRKLKSKLDKKTEQNGEESHNAAAATVTANAAGKEEEPKKDKKKKDKKEKPGRGVETMFRTTSTNHIRLSSMADSKANIMISVNSIIISVLLSVLLRKLEDNPNLILPAIIFLTTCVTTIIFSVLATRPNVSSGQFTKQDIENKKTNLLFFGNFHGMSLTDYNWGMKEMMKDPDFLYGSMIQDVYSLGVVLGRKYRLLRIAYNIFMFGLIISVLAFVIAAVFFPVKD
jgi:predicted metal-dependent HD superfamily phosphohydrolase